MKKLIIALLVVGLLPIVASAADEQETWKWSGSAWVSQGVGDVQADARCWTSFPAAYYCNKKTHLIDVTIHASVAQWISWSISGTRWDWKVRKPGTYAADCITGFIQSNQDVFIDYEGFADLQTLGTSINPTIPICYGFGPSLAQAEINGWVPAAALNNDDDMLLDSQDLHDGISWKLWNKIEVVNCNSACEYEDAATITLTLQVIKTWIDPATGYFL